MNYIVQRLLRNRFAIIGNCLRYYYATIIIMYNNIIKTNNLII